MTQLKYAVYPPREPNVPWLAVVLKDDQPVDVFGCPDEDSAERVLFEMKTRNDAKNGSAYT